MEQKGKRLALHACCAICASEISERMKKGHHPVIFFSNPNIDTREEYDKRKDSARRLAEDSGLPFFEDNYDRTEWLASAGIMKNELEGGKRCLKCFELRLRRTADFAKRNDITEFSTTLPASPFKDESAICVIGKKIGEDAGIAFIDPLQGINKKELWHEALQKAKKAGYYRQKYCGCEFSKR